MADVLHEDASVDEVDAMLERLVAAGIEVCEVEDDYDDFWPPALQGG